MKNLKLFLSLILVVSMNANASDTLIKNGTIHIGDGSEPFVGDVYNNPVGQSITDYPTFNSWFLSFMIPYVSKASSYVTPGGYLAITFLDRKETPHSNLI